MAKDSNGKELQKEIGQSPAGRYMERFEYKGECRQAIFTNVSRINDIVALRDMVELSDILRRHYSDTGNETISTDEYKIISIFHGSMKLNSNALKNIEFFVTALAQEPPESNKPQRSSNS